MDDLISALEAEIKSATDTEHKINLMSRLSDALRRVNIEKSLAVSLETVELAKSISYKEGLAHAYRKSGISCRILSRFDDAFQYFEKALEILNELNDKLGKAKVIQSIANIYLNLGDYKYALDYLHRCLLILKDLDEKQFEASILSTIGLAYQESGDFTSSLESYLKSMQIYSESSIDIPASLLNNIGIVYMNLEDYETSLDYFNRSMKLATEKNNVLDRAFALGNIGIVHSHLKNYERAIEYYNESFVILHSLGNKLAESNALVNIGNAYKDLGQYDKAIDYQQSHLRLQEEIADLSGKASALLSIGNIYFEMSETEQAKKYYLDALRISQDIGDVINETASHINLGKLFAREKNTVLALDNLYMAIELAEKRNAKKDLSGIHKILYEIFRNVGNYEKAFHHFEQYFTTEKEIINSESDRRMKSLSIQYQFQNAESEKKIALQEKEIYMLKNIELAEANENLIRVNEEKNEFMGIAAHDLRNPLSGILSFSRKLQTKFDTYDKEKICEIAHNIEITSEKMFDLIAKMLDINAIESGKRNLSIQKFDASRVIEKVVNDFRKPAEKKNISIVSELQEEMLINSDSKALEQILENLISNAVKFTLPGKNIKIKAASINNTIHIDVKDSGPGLTETDMQKLFGRFTRLSAQPTGNENSTGLGLSISKKLTELLSGKIWCENNAPDGAVFKLELPLNIN
jgi:signal transduction histidine kinase/Tfp pilus assembly protein PilF